MKNEITFEDIMQEYKPSLDHHGGKPKNVTVQLSEFVNNACSIDAYKNMTQGSRSCFSKEQLLKIAEKYNESYPENKIVYNSRLRKDDLWNRIQDRLSSSCNVEWCWLDQSFLKGSGMNYSLEAQFKPRGPKGKNDWLSTTHIDDAMRLYEKLYPNFRFFGPVPIDFDALYTEIKELDPAKLYGRGITKIGVIFNLDPSTKGGSHWVALYADFVLGEVYFFDSYGVCPPAKEIVVLKNRLLEGLKNLYEKLGHVGHVPKYRCNTVRHQYGNSECGVYSMYFILELLRGRTFDMVTKNIILDEEIRKFRNIYFRPKYN